MIAWACSLFVDLPQFPVILSVALGSAPSPATESVRAPEVRLRGSRGPASATKDLTEVAASAVADIVTGAARSLLPASMTGGGSKK